MSTESQSKVRIDLGPSRILAVVFLLLHAGALALVVLMPLLIAARVALAILIIASLCFVLAYHALRRASSSVVALSIDEEGGCEVRRRSARGAENGQLVDCWVHPLLTLLVLRGEGRRWRVNVVVPADAVGKEAFRRLRVRLLSRSAGA